MVPLAHRIERILASHPAIAVLALGIATAGCAPDRDYSFGRGVLEFLLAMPDSIADSSCHRVYLHPLIGKDFLLYAQTRGEPWQVIGSLPPPYQEPFKRGERVFMFVPFTLNDTTADACLAFASHASPPQTEDSAVLHVEVFVRRAGEWFYGADVVAHGRRQRSQWTFIMRGVQVP